MKFLQSLSVGLPLWRRGAWVVGCTLLVATSAAWAGSPRVTGSYPSGAQRGTEAEIAFSGSNLSDAREILFDEPGFQVTALKAESGLYLTKVKIAPEVRLGEHAYRVVTNSGISDLRLFYVSPFPLVEHTTPAKPAEAERPQAIDLNTTVYGRTPGDKQDHFLVEAKKGQRLSIEAIGCKLQSQNIFDPEVIVAREDGAVLKTVDDAVFGRQDPVFSIVVPDDGKYVVTIKESTNAGIGECHYLLHIGTFAQPLGIYPPGGRAGETVPVQLLGDATGPIAAEARLPSGRASTYEFFADTGAPAPMPNLMRVSPFPNVLETEPNDTTATATPATGGLPVALNGIIEKKGDIDYFTIPAKKGQVYEVDVFARRLRSPLDSVLAIYDGKGNKLAENDDDGMPDSHLRWTAPADGDFFVSVTDQLKRGGPLFTYRVEIHPTDPKLTVSLPEVVINSSQERRAIPVPKGNRYATLVRVKRADVGGEVQLTPEGLPAGVTWNGAPIDKGVDTIPVVFEATPEAAPVAAAFHVTARIDVPGTDPASAKTVTGKVSHVVDIIENGNQKAFYSITEEALPIAVTDAVPVKLTLVPPKVPILMNGSLDLKVKIEREGAYKGPVSLSLLYNPPGIGSGGPAQVKEGQTDGVVTISCTDKAPNQTWKVCVVGTADFGKGPVWLSSELVGLQVAPAFVGGQIQRTFIDQGDTGSLTVKLEPKVDFEGKATIALMGLPQGVTAVEREITKEDKEVKFDLKADATAMAGQHRALFCQFKLVKDGETMTTTFAQGGVLRVDKATVAKNDPKK